MLEGVVGNVVTNVISNSVSGFVEAGTRTIGGYAGDFIIKSGDILESYGRTVGTSIASKGESWGNSIKGNQSGSSGRPVAVRSKSAPSVTHIGSSAGARSGTVKKTNALPTAKKAGPSGVNRGLPSSAQGSKPYSSTAYSPNVSSTANARPKNTVTSSKPPAKKPGGPSVATSSTSGPTKKVVPEARSLPQHLRTQTRPAGTTAKNVNGGTKKTAVSSSAKPVGVAGKR